MARTIGGPDGSRQRDRRTPSPPKSGGPPIRLFPPRPNGWIKGLSIFFGLASGGIWLALSAGHSAADEMPTALAASLAATVLLYHIGYLVAPFLVGRGVWPSFLGALVLAPALHGWVLVYPPAVPVSANVIAAVGAGCLAALVILYVIALRQLVTAMLNPGRRR